MKKHSKSVTVMLSGGIDSTACVQFYLSQKANVSALFIDYGQPAAQQERIAASKVAKHYDVSLEKLKISGLKNRQVGYIIGRNALLLDIALVATGTLSSVVAIGVHSGTDYPDCSEHFVATLQASYDLYANGQVVVAAPFLQWSKRDVWDYFVLKKIPFELTYSCELGRKQPCGACPSCLALETLHAG